MKNFKNTILCLTIFIVICLFNSLPVYAETNKLYDNHSEVCSSTSLGAKYSSSKTGTYNPGCGENPLWDPSVSNFGMNRCAELKAAEKLDYPTPTIEEDGDYYILTAYTAGRIDTVNDNNGNWRVNDAFGVPSCPSMDVRYTSTLDLNGLLEEQEMGLNINDMQIESVEIYKTDIKNSPYSSLAMDFLNDWTANNYDIYDTTSINKTIYQYTVDVKNLGSIEKNNWLGYNGLTKEQYEGGNHIYHYYIPFTVKIKFKDNSIEKNPCVDYKYAFDNPGKCCDEYPETCCEQIGNGTISFNSNKWQHQFCCDSDSNNPKIFTTKLGQIHNFNFYNKSYYDKYCPSNIISGNTCSNYSYFISHPEECCSSADKNTFKSNKNICCIDELKSDSKYREFCPTKKDNCSDEDYFVKNPEICCKNADNKTFENRTNICCIDELKGNSKYKNYCPGEENIGEEDKNTSCYRGINSNENFTLSYKHKNSNLTIKDTVKFTLDKVQAKEKIVVNSGMGFNIQGNVIETIKLPNKYLITRNNYKKYNNMVDELKGKLRNLVNSNGSNNIKRSKIILTDEVSNTKYKMGINDIGYDRNSINKILNADKNKRICVSYYYDDNGNRHCNSYEYYYGINIDQITISYNVYLPQAYINYSTLETTFNKSDISVGRKVMTNTEQKTGYYDFNISFQNSGLYNMITSNSDNYTCQYLSLNTIKESSTSEKSIYDGPDYYFRPISLTNPFPNNNRVIGPNWISENIRKNYITEKSINYNEPMYEITLDSSMVQDLRNYNASQNVDSKDGYLNDTLKQVGENKLGGTSKLLSCLSPTNPDDSSDCDSDMIEHIKGNHKSKIKLPSSSIRKDTSGALKEEEKQGIREE